MLRFLAVAVPGYKPLCRQTVSKNLQNRYKVIRKKIKEILERIKYVALTTDVWKSRTRMNKQSRINNYCLIWFRAYSKWGCLDSLRETGGYFDKNIPNCGYRHNDLDN